MKKLIFIFIVATMFYSCDDGDIVLENLNFSNVSILKCGNSNDTGLLFKLNGSEILLINIPSTNFNSTTSTADNPKVYTIQNDQIIYRKYNATVSSNAICSLIPPATPIVSGEWKGAPGGRIEIITTERFQTDSNTGIVSVIGYSHVIKFKNVTLVGNGNNFTYDDYMFGEYIINN